MSYKPVTDHLGNTFPSKTAMLRHYGIPEISFKYRLSKGWSLEKTLTTPLSDSKLATAIPCEDHLGNKFESKKEMCDFWHVPRALFFRRIRTPGWDLERALTQPINKDFSRNKRNTVEGPNGKTYWNIDEMCADYNIPKSQYIINIRNGLSMEESLVARTEPQKHPKDHLGNVYKSVNEMCRAYGITKTVLRSRLELGWTLKQILTAPGKKLNFIESVDHEGQKFSSQKEMLEHYNVSYGKYKHRLKKGLGLKTALTEGSIHTIACEDHRGNKFKTLADMLEYWMCQTGSYYKAMEKNNLKGTLIGRYRKIILPPGMKVKKRLRDEYFLVSINGAEYVWNDITLFKYARMARLDEKIKACGPQITKDLAIKSKLGDFYEVIYKNETMLLSSDAAYRLAFLKYARFD